MKPILLILPFLALGCASNQAVDMPDRLPHLVEQEPLPPLPRSMSINHVVFDLRMQVTENGSVANAEILNPSGDPTWDSLALAKMGKWIFSPALRDGKPISMWVTMAAKVRFEEPVFMRLAEIVCPSPTIADSVRALLLGGQDFSTLASGFSVSRSKEEGGNLGRIDICRYRDEVKKVLADLSVNEISVPVAVGDKYIIFKHLSDEVRIQ